jgi:L-lactate dehydrogenase complex protein LldE
MPDISSAMGRAKLSGIEVSRAEVLTSTDGGCLMQLVGTMKRNNLRMPVKHVAELLWEGVEKRVS